MTASADGCDRWRARDNRTTGMGPEIADALAKLEARDPKQSGGTVAYANGGRVSATVPGAFGYSFLSSIEDIFANTLGRISCLENERYFPSRWCR